MWRIWAYALGRKEGRDKSDADKIAFIRTILMIQLVVTNGFIISGVIRHWNSVDSCNTGTNSLTAPDK